eukprot:686749-Hanusia_phi.AAC.1
MHMARSRVTPGPGPARAPLGLRRGAAAGPVRSSTVTEPESPAGRSDRRTVRPTVTVRCAAPARRTA